MTDVVGKQDISDAMFPGITKDILGEIAAIYHMDFLKRMEEVAWKGIAETVFQDKQMAAIACGGLHHGGVQIASHKGQIG